MGQSQEQHEFGSDRHVVLRLRPSFWDTPGTKEPIHGQGPFSARWTTRGCDGTRFATRQTPHASPDHGPGSGLSGRVPAHHWSRNVSLSKPALDSIADAVYPGLIAPREI